MIDDRIYRIGEVITFFKTDEKYGFLSNMKGKQKILVNNVWFSSSEAIYQSLKYPKNKAIQYKIMSERSPILAKKISISNKKDMRQDWDIVKNNIMRLCIRIRAFQSQEFVNILLSTDKKIIVEISRKDTYWGTVFINEFELKGKNVLGRLLMELRDEINNGQIYSRSLDILNKTPDIIINNKIITLESLIRDAEKNNLAISSKRLLGLA
jgi:ribA/ribD-fused uncharacterized protein